MATAYRTLTDKTGRRDYLRGQWATLWQSKPDQSFSADEVASLRSWNAEMDELGAEIDELRSLEAMATAHLPGRVSLPTGEPEPDASLAAPTRMRSTREVFANDPGYKAFRQAGRGTAVIEFGGDTELGAQFDPSRGATTITVSSAAPQPTRLARIEPYPLERRTVRDLMMQGTMDTPVLEYYEETTFTNAAAETAEGSSKPEAALAWTLRSQTAAKIAVWIPATTESLQDISWLESTLRNRLAFMVQRREEQQLMNGDGISPNLLGITQRSGVQTQAKGADPVFDAILKAMTLIQVNSFYDPDAVVVHPMDWQDILLTRTADGLYILGNPGDPTAARRLWGLEVRPTTGQTQNTGVVGAYGTAAQVFQRVGITITVSTEHSTFFIDNKVAILAEERLALATYRPSAFCTVTGI